MGVELIKCASAGLNTCKIQERKMWEYIAGVRVICGRKNVETGNNVLGQDQSGQAIKLFQARRKISFPFHF